MKNFHEVANIFPMLNESELRELAEDIGKYGLREPIWLYEDKIIDGRNRYRACVLAGIEPEFREWDGKGSLIAFVVSLNLKRRHLDESQRAMVAGRIATLGAHRPDKSDPIGAVSQPQAAEQLNISRHSVQRARQVLKKGAPELIEAVERGEMAVSRAANISKMPKEKQIEEIRRPHIAQATGEAEWYTPSKYIEAARVAMGSIDLDPASCEEANKTVQARRYYTKEEDGLTKNWFHTVWLNPPYSRLLVSQFVETAIAKYKKGEYEQACILTNNATETVWFNQLLKISSAVCFPLGRIVFINKHGHPGQSPLQGQAIVYIGHKPKFFARAFDKIGEILVPYGR